MKYESQAENVHYQELLDNTALLFFQKQRMNLDLNYSESKCVKEKFISYCLSIIDCVTNSCAVIVYGR